MKSRIATYCIALTAAWALVPRPVVAVETAGVAVLAAPSAEVVQQRVQNWLTTVKDLQPETQQQIDALWRVEGELPAEKLLERVIATFSLVDAPTKELVEACRFQDVSVHPPDAQLLDAENLDSFYTNNLRLYYGRYLTQRRMYEEGLAVFDNTAVTEVVDPATYLFFKAVCQHHLLMKQEGLKTIEQLTARTEGVPSRYSTVATLMQYDLEGLKEKSLDEISRKMLDVERRLDLGRSGQKVQKVEEEIIAGLDEIIKKIEQQSGGGGGGGGEGGNSNNPANGAEDSGVKGATAPGTVDPKDIQKGGKWGGLDDKARSRIKQLIGRDFPNHYRRAVEEYFRNAAKRTVPTNN